MRLIKDSICCQQIKNGGLTNNLMATAMTNEEVEKNIDISSIVLSGSQAMWFINNITSQENFKLLNWRLNNAVYNYGKELGIEGYCDLMYGEIKCGELEVEICSNGRYYETVTFIEKSDKTIEGFNIISNYLTDRVMRYDQLKRDFENVIKEFFKYLYNYFYSNKTYIRYSAINGDFCDLTNIDEKMFRVTKDRCENKNSLFYLCVFIEPSINKTECNNLKKYFCNNTSFAGILLTQGDGNYKTIKFKCDQGGFCSGTELLSK